MIERIAMRVSFLLIALMWVGMVGFFTTTIVEKMTQAGATPFDLIVAHAVGLVCLFPTLAIASRVTAWIAGSSHPTKSKH